MKRELWNLRTNGSPLTTINMSRFLKVIETDGCGGSFCSFNSQYHLVELTTKVIIVGTITSPQGRGTNKDFYYMSPYNPTYRILDAYFKDTHFVQNKKAGNISAIIEELKSKGIAFIDVVDSCSNPKNSSLDDDLINIKLDYESFKDINDNIVLIANSKNAYGALLKIAQRNNLKNKIIYVYGFRFYKQEDWNEAFKAANL